MGFYHTKPVDFELVHQKLQILVKALIAGKLKGMVSEKEEEVIHSFEAYVAKYGHLTPKQWKWCNNILFKHKSVFIDNSLKNLKFEPTEKIPALKPQMTNPKLYESHRKYSRVVEEDE